MISQFSKSWNSSRLLVSCIVLMAAWAAGCSSTTKVQSVRPNEHIEIGWTPRTVFQSPAYAWFDTGYIAYHPQEEYLARLKRMKDSIDIVVVYGTWCSDSQRELPRFFKIMDVIGFPSDRIKLIAVDRTKRLPAGVSQEYAITLVPTFIVKYRGVEIGRIIESAKTTLEQDLTELLSPLFQ